VIAVAKGYVYEYKADNICSKEQLGITCRPVEKALVDLFKPIVDYGLISE